MCNAYTRLIITKFFEQNDVNFNPIDESAFLKLVGWKEQLPDGC